MQSILTRRSIRKYKDKPVSDDLIKQVLEAAMAAPSAGNEQPWQFIVINDRKILGQIPAIHPNASMTKDAPLAILVCGDLSKEKYPGYWSVDCSAATENLLLAVHALGLGAVWCGIYPREERIEGMKKMLGIPDGIVPFALVPIGYPGEEKPPSERFEKERIHYNKW
jgi:nitroreductase